jgi:hypothetical protein
MNTYLKSICIKVAIQISALYFLFHFEIDKLSNDTYFGMNVRSMVVYYVLIQMVYGITRDFCEWKLPKYKDDKKFHVYIAEIIFSTVAAGISCLTLIQIYFGGSSCEGTSLHLPIHLYEGLCVGPDIESDQPHTSVVFSRSGIERVPIEYSQQVVELEDSCLIRNIYLIGQSIQLSVVLYQSELFYLNHEMRIELQMHHACAIMCSLITFYGEASTVTLQVAYINFFFAMFEQPVFISLILYKVLDKKYNLKAKLFLFSAIFWVITKLFTFIVSIYALVANGDKIDSTTKYFLFVICVVFAVTQTYTVMSLKGLYLKCKKKAFEN